MPSPVIDIHIDFGEPPPEVKEYAREHCGEDPNNRLQAIYELRDLIYERGECTPHRMDDDFLIKFLRARNFIPQRAHRLMVNYYQFREDNPELFYNIYPLDLRYIGESNVICIPPYRDQDGRRIVLFRIGVWDPKVISVEDLFKATILALELGILEQRIQILGGIAIFDLDGIGTQHAWQVTPSVAAKMVQLLVSCFPAKPHAVHIINHSWLFDKVYNVFKPLLSSEMRTRIYFHGYDNTSLHKHIHPEHLPERYGGIWPDYTYTIWLEKLRSDWRVIKELLSCGYKIRESEISDEIKRKLKEEGVDY